MAVRIAAAAALGFAMSWGRVWAAEAVPTLEMSADGEVQIGVDGNVTDYRLASELSPQVAALVDKKVRGFEFEPIVVDGAAVVARTTIHLGLKGEPTDVKDQYRIRIANVRFGDLRRGAFKMHPPHYPMEAVKAHLGAKVLLAIRVDESGDVVDAQPYQTSLDARANSEQEAERWRKLFESASITAARSWHYDPSEKLNGKPVGTSALVPVDFFVADVGRAPKPGAWKAYLPGPVHPVPWLKQQHIAEDQDIAALDADRGLALDSRFRLKEDVIGKTL